MKRIIMVSYPISGSTVLYESILKIFKENGKEISGCTNYHACVRVPCECKNPALLTKTHDFDLDHKISDDNLYIIIVRKNKMENIERYIRFELGYLNNPDPSNTVKRIIPIKKEELDGISHLIKPYHDYYDNFLKKYIKPENKNFCIIFKEDFEENPMDTLKNIINFLGIEIINGNIDDYVKNMLDKNPIKFTKFDPGYNNWIAQEFNKYIV